MSKGQAEPITLSAAVKQRPARNLCVYAPHSGSSSSSSHLKPLSNRAGRDPEQATNRLDSNVQKNTTLEVDKTILSGTERSIALKHKEQEDPTLIHKPQDEANQVLEAKVLQNICRTFDASSLHQFLVNQALWRSFMNSCLCATVHLNKDEHYFKRIIRNLEMQKRRISEQFNSKVYIFSD